MRPPDAHMHNGIPVLSLTLRRRRCGRSSAVLRTWSSSSPSSRPPVKQPPSRRRRARQPRRAGPPGRQPHCSSASSSWLRRGSSARNTAGGWRRWRGSCRRPNLLGRSGSGGRRCGWVWAAWLPGRAAAMGCGGMVLWGALPAGLVHSPQPRCMRCLRWSQDAEQRAAAASEAADEANAAAARLVGRRQAQAEGRAADVEAQAKAASLRALVGGASSSKKQRLACWARAWMPSALRIAD